MSRISLMTWGLLLILLGVQLNLVDSFVLTPQATEFWKQRTTARQFETVPGNYVATSNGYYSNPIPNAYNSANSNRVASEQSKFPYSSPNYRRYRQGGLPTIQSGFGTGKTGMPRFASRSTTSDSAGPQKMVTPPNWFCWPPIFLGAVLFLFGAAGRD